MNFLLLPVFTAYLSPTDFGISAILAIMNLVVTGLFSSESGAATGLCYFEGNDPRRKEETLWTSAFMLAGTACHRDDCLFLPAPGQPTSIRDTRPCQGRNAVPLSRRSNYTERAFLSRPDARKTGVPVCDFLHDGDDPIVGLKRADRGVPQARGRRDGRKHSRRQRSRIDPVGFSLCTEPPFSPEWRGGPRAFAVRHPPDPVFIFPFHSSASQPVHPAVEINVIVRKGENR